MDERRDHLWKVANETDERAQPPVPEGAYPMGLDVGTSKVVAARRRGREIESATQLNAFLPKKYSKLTENILSQNGVSYYREGDELVVYGSATERFANMFNEEARRPMSDGMLNPREKLGLPVLEAILQTLLPKARVAGETLAFSVPAAAPGRAAELTYHEATLRKLFESYGYKTVAINEGLAVVFAEDRKSTRLNSSHSRASRMPSSA